MINLANYYGDKIFNRKDAYRKGKIIPYISGLLFEVVVAIIIVHVFDIKWDYAVIKVYGLMFAYDFLKPIVSWPIDKINYKLFLGNALRKEMNHYIRVFDMPMNEYNTCTYDDFLLHSAFAGNIETDDRVLAAINYATVVSIAATHPRMEGIYHQAWADTINKYIEDNPIKYVTIGM